MKNETVIYSQIWRKGVKGRIVEVKGKYIAQVGDGSSSWQRANTKQAASLFRNALQVNNLRTGDRVVAWDGSRLVLGHFIGWVGDRREVNIGRRDGNLFLENVLPLSVAQSEGIWSFRNGMQVAAYVNEKWVKATWLGFDEGFHQVRLGNGQVEYSERAHTAYDALEMQLIEG
jgi:hypothetical protein